LAKSTLSYPEAAVVSCICFGLFILWSTQAVLAGFTEAQFSDAGNAWMIGPEATLAIAALLYLRARGFDIASLYPQPTLRGSFFGLALFVACWLVGVVATSLVYTPGKSQMAEFSFSGLSLAGIVLFAVVNGAFEEVFLLGALVRGLRGFGLSVAIGLPLLVRVLYHLYQGPLGAVWIASFGGTLTVAYVASGRLWPPVLAHILWDIVPLL
jgi:uncharacterized protein